MAFAGNTKDYTGVKIYMTNVRPPKLAAVYALANYDDIPPKLNHYYVRNTIFGQSVNVETRKYKGFAEFMFRHLQIAPSCAISKYRLFSITIGRPGIDFCRFCG